MTAKLVVPMDSLACAVLPTASASGSDSQTVVSGRVEVISASMPGAEASDSVSRRTADGRLYRREFVGEPPRLFTFVSSCTTR